MLFSDKVVTSEQCKVLLNTLCLLNVFPVRYCLSYKHCKLPYRALLLLLLFSSDSGKAQEKCPLCQVSYVPDYKGNVCKMCMVSDCAINIP